ncbi:MAG: hypothetical protein J4F31_05260 [Flavobacteriales bacterium]|nr:hypothetical protein [Flavobacteriales bacterium]
MKAAIKVIEIMWVVIAAVSVVELVRLWNTPGNKKWIFGAFLVFAIFMYWFRRKQRIRMEQRMNDRNDQDGL